MTVDFDHFFAICTGRQPYGYQRSFATCQEWPDLVEAPTGSGKTATAVLGWLWRRRHGSEEKQREAGRRLVFCLPMRTLVEQTHRVVCGWRDKLGLTDTELGVHLLMGGAVDDAWEEYPERDTILIGTQDQLLSRALVRGYAMSRYKWPIHFALLHNDCTWVMDEVQLMGVAASTVAQLQAFRERFSVVGNAKTIWMTATLASEKLRTIDVTRPFAQLPFSVDAPELERRFVANKALSKAKEGSGKKDKLKALVDEIATAHVADTLTIVIVNRVARAQELVALLRKDRRAERVALIHSRFRPADRKRIQDEVLSGTFRGVLVATQAIEAGVDISAKTLFTELAPWASLVQRFGRLNRAGEHTDSRAIWIDLDTTDAEVCLPYEGEVLATARGRLAALDDVSPRSLTAVARDLEEPELPVIRRKDFLELFDTEPDLAGHDIDISRYVRATEDRDVQVAWRAIGSRQPGADTEDLQREELCTVPVHAIGKLRKLGAIWRFDGLRHRWIEVDRLVPGMAVLVDVAFGGYDAELGFTGERSDVPAPIETHGAPPDADADDPLTYRAARFVELAVHADDTAIEMATLLDALGTNFTAGEDRQDLIAAARWHDAGKAHPAFQEMIVSGLAFDDPRRDQGPWAKSDGRPGRRNQRAFFRHELASALAWLAAGNSDLGAFLIAAHHGKVRLSLRSRPGEEPPPGAPRRFANGVHDGDQLPETDLGAGVSMPAQTLSLACMEAGSDQGEPTWADRMFGLLDRLGPFRLAYLESLIRIADWRASRKRGVPNPEVAR